MGSARDGVRIQGTGANNNALRDNRIGIVDRTGTIVGNAGNGVTILAGTGNELSFSSLFDNDVPAMVGNGKLGIDLGGDGVTPNDTNDADTGANNLQNFPVITSVNATRSSAAIQGTLNAKPNTGFNIEFFSSGVADPSGFGEGQTFIGRTQATTNAQGNVTFRPPSISHFRWARHS